MVKKLGLIFCVWALAGTAARAGLSDAGADTGRNFQPSKLTDYSKMVFSTKEFSTKTLNEKESSEFDPKRLSGFGTWDNKEFKGTYNTKEFQGVSTYAVSSKSPYSALNTYNPGGKEIKGKVLEFQPARESGQMTNFADKKFPGKGMDERYSGPELKVISKEVKVINDTLKNKDDLKDQRLSMDQIREILNKNK